MRAMWVLGFGGALATIVTGCPADFSGECVDATCSSVGDGGPGDADGAGPDGTDGDGSARCPSGTDPKDDIANCVIEADGLFVNAGAADGGDGSKARPYKTIGDAISNLGGRARIFVCDGVYPENVTVGTTVSLYGGFECSFSSYNNSRPKVVPANGAALSVSASSVTIEDIEFDGPDHSTGKNGESSIAATVNSAQGVVFTRVTLKAQGGGAGKDGKAPDAQVPHAADGNAAIGTSGGLGQPAAGPGACANGSGSTQGGAGGAQSGIGNPGKPAYVPSIPDSGHDGAGGTGSGSCGTGGTAHDGSAGPNGDGGPGAISVGTLSGIAWNATAGSAGMVGKVGQGGGGGAGESTGGGGGGGAGGCGGLGGDPGSGGGASIALVSVGSTIAFHASTVSAGSGGRGGSGAAGQTGQGGGFSANGSGDGCQSGKGGNGGTGGGGGGGAGGSSFGMLYKDTPPSQADGTVVSKGVEGPAGTGQPNAGALGKSANAQDVAQL